jgi:hypothetical protein
MKGLNKYGIHSWGYKKQDTDILNRIVKGDLKNEKVMKLLDLTIDNNKLKKKYQVIQEDN